MKRDSTVVVAKWDDDDFAVPHILPSRLPTSYDHVKFRNRSFTPVPITPAEEIPVSSAPTTEEAEKSTLHVPEHAVTPEFREMIRSHFPGLSNRKPYWRLMGHLMFASTTKNGAIPIPYTFLARIEGKTINSKYRARTFIESFTADTGLKMEISAYKTGVCRTVTRIYWPLEVKTLLAAELRVVGGDKVLMSTGSKWRKEHSIQDRREQQAQAIEILSNMGHHPASNLLHLLNNAAPNRFAAIKQHLPDAHSLVDSLPLIDSERERQHTILKAIERTAQPFYGPSPRSVRIFSLFDSITRLQRDVRKTMCQDWIACDLRSAQLAIVAKTWGKGIPEVEEFLRSGESVWKMLCKWMCLDFNSDKKAALKNCLYAIIFGAGRDRLISFCDKYFGPNSYKRLKDNKIIHALLLARSQELRTIRQAKKGVDAFGKEILLEYIARPDKHFDYDSSRQIMALVAQSYELKLLSPIVDLALEQSDKEHGFVLLSWLHDGFCFVPNRSEDKDAWTLRLKEAVRVQADALGMVTELEV